MNRDRPEQQAPVGILALMLFVSGGCALTFQVVWIRELRLIFGATTAASGAVLAVFMAGLGLGNWLFGRRIDRVQHPLRFYACLEAGIAISAGVSPWLIDGIRTLYIGLGGQAALGSELATLLRLGASAVILAVPTLLMGGTIPAAARAVSIDSDVKRRGVALIYGLNTLGAVYGAGMANFALIEMLGNRAVLWAACVVNILLAYFAWRVSRSLTLRSAPKSIRRVAESSESTPDEAAHPIGLVCLSSAIVGFAFFLMEMVWYRMLGPLLGGTTYTFGLILCIALFGIGVGGALYGLFSRWLKPSPSLLAATCAVEALLIGIPFWYGDEIAMWVLHQRNEPIATFADQVWNWCQVGAFVILPASLVAGFQFPVLIAIAGSGRENIGRHVGWTFAANTLGAISGSLAGGFWLLPRLTAPGVWRLAIGLLVALGLTVAFMGRRSNKLGLMLTGVVAVLALLTIRATGPTAVWRHSGIGAGRADLPGPGRNAEQDYLHNLRRCRLWEAEGRESSVAIIALDSLAFIVNGKSDGNAYGDAGTQIGLGLIGPLLHPDPRTGLVIGLGTGESAGWLADVEGMTSVDVVELEPIVTQMAERCASVNRQALSNPKLHLHTNDAREFLLTVDKQYDLIVSEPSNPYRAGIANLYTQEFYTSAAARLTGDGLFLQWLQGYEIDERTVKIV
ncbi:MAG TPA: fused MFS/spermidine synthase, partial [Planctomycetaceae bacterium]|nr:fused MFS/spermidine synthase [Planctomycetaceae bacterium]